MHRHVWRCHPVHAQPIVIWHRWALNVAYYVDAAHIYAIKECAIIALWPGSCYLWAQMCRLFDLEGASCRRRHIRYGWSRCLHFRLYHCLWSSLAVAASLFLREGCCNHITRAAAPWCILWAVARLALKVWACCEWPTWLPDFEKHSAVTMVAFGGTMATDASITGKRVSVEQRLSAGLLLTRPS